MAFLEHAAELLRQRRTGDDKFLKSLLYFFELRIPEKLAGPGAGPYVYPLILNPEEYRLSEPFAIEKSFTAGGGVFVEENGIIVRELHISGTTGFKPRPLKVSSGILNAALPPEGKSYARTFPRTLVDSLSGHAHFKFLQDAVFRTYGDLKRDPSTAKETELYFHVLKDDEHWRCMPVRFELARTASRPLEYPYSFELLVVDPASAKDIALSEDQEVLEKLKDGSAVINLGVALVRSALTDLANVTQEVKAKLLSGTSVLVDAAASADAAESFLKGVSRTIEVPIAYMATTTQLMEDVLEANVAATEVPASVLNTLRRVVDGINLIRSYPSRFQNNVDARVESYNDQIALANTPSRQQALKDAAASEPPSTLRDFEDYGTAPLPGDKLRRDSDLGMGKRSPRYQSAREHVLERGETLPTLAARYLGDARRWKYIALFNDLVFPFLSEQGLPFTKKVGDVILIPSTAAPPEAIDSPATMGVDPTAPLAEQLLGTDYELVSVSQTQYDFEIDVEQGSTDFLKVRGLDCLKQGLLVRMRTERGTDILYKRLGTHRVVGLGFKEIDLELAQIRVMEAIQDDPRVNAIRSFRLVDDEDTASDDDRLQVEMDVEIRGLSASIPVRA